MDIKTTTIGFIGQGWIGKHYADDFEQRGYNVVRYGLEPQYVGNKLKIAECDIVFIAVPTPTTPDGFSIAAVDDALSLVGKGKIAVIKSTVLMGMTLRLARKYKDKIVLHVPEFLSEKTAAFDVAYPARNIIGLAFTTKEYQKAAKKVLSIIPSAPYKCICSSGEAEFLKYMHNIYGYVAVVLANVLYDLAHKEGFSWDTIKDATLADPFATFNRYMNPLHKSGRGAGGNCFIKDFEAFIEYAAIARADEYTRAMLDAIRNKNISLLVKSNKDAHLVKGVYGTPRPRHIYSRTPHTMFVNHQKNVRTNKKKRK